MGKVCTFLFIVLLGYFMVRWGQTLGVVETNVVYVYRACFVAVVLLFLLTYEPEDKSGKKSGIITTSPELSNWLLCGICTLTFSVAFGTFIPDTGPNPLNWVSLDPHMFFAVLAFFPLLYIALSMLWDVVIRALK